MAAAAQAALAGPAVCRAGIAALAPQRALRAAPAVSLGALRLSSAASLSAGARLLVPAAASQARTVALFSKSKDTGKPASGNKLTKKLVNTTDGIFGTSGGIGFTKQNELFVGRMAMLGFAASLLGEALTGKGPLAQFDIETGLPLNETEPLLIFFILFTLLGAVGGLGDRGKFIAEPVGAVDKPIVEPGKGIRGGLGLRPQGKLFGFTKANELFVGRMAQLGFAISIIGEVITGKGALAQLNIETGVPVTEIEPVLLFFIAILFTAAINPGTGRFVNDDELEA
eukprot:SM000270S10360  [mRNA]  locus=s270:70283:71792:+ [translate_table: standard]